MNNEIILYRPNELAEHIEVRLEDETVWLTQVQMAALFGQTKQNISLHINNCFKEGELEKKATVKESLTVQKEGSRNVKRKLEFYNLDVIISVGYRVKSKQGTQFRIWATNVLRDYLLMSKGWMYILECVGGSYYTGSTNNLELRLKQHQAGEGANHTRKRLPVKPVYFEEFDRVDQAFYREKQVQGWSRKKKEALMNGTPKKLHELARCMNETPHIGFGSAQPTESETRSLSEVETKGFPNNPNPDNE